MYDSGFFIACSSASVSSYLFFDTSCAAEKQHMLCCDQTIRTHASRAMRWGSPLLQKIRYGRSLLRSIFSTNRKERRLYSFGAQIFYRIGGTIIFKVLPPHRKDRRVFAARERGPFLFDLRPSCSHPLSFILPAVACTSLRILYINIIYIFSIIIFPR